MPDENLYDILPQVQKPSRYIGAEVNSCIKDPAAVRARFALCFPDVYEVGMSHLGLKVLYEALNARPDVYAERAYAPWPDMERAQREHGISLTTVETSTPLSVMDVVGFTLQYELSYSNILNMVELSGLPLLARERGDAHPLVIAGGPCAFNPEPLADFMDLFVIGDSEEAIVEIAGAVIAHKEQGGGSRAGLLKRLSAIEGVYVPSQFEVVRAADGKIAAINNTVGGPDRVRKRVVADLDKAAYPESPVVPYTAAVHNRVTLEVARGCTRGCRFCQAGYTYRPLRERSPGKVMELAEKSVLATGYEELSLSSLSTGDYSRLLELMKALMDRYERRRVSISLPSLRVGTLSPEVCREIKRVRKTGFTIAPEAGTQRLRDVINKGVTEEALVETARTVFSEGWDLIKLYFMTGLPTETDEDLEGIIELSRKVLAEGRKAGSRKSKVNVGVSAFVPKPHTPFQWLGQEPLAVILEKKKRLFAVLGKKPFAMKSGRAEMSVLEAALARGGREAGRAVQRAFERGARFDGWTDMFSYDIWKAAFEDAGLDLEAEAGRNFGPDEILPWDHIDSGVTKKFLRREYEKALEGRPTPDCRVKCTSCGLKCDEPGPATPPLPAGLGYQDKVAAAAAARPGLPPARVRLTYTKLCPLNFLSHTELMTLFFRAISRAGLPIRFSEGFNPHPKVSFGPALAVGIESEAEILDMELSYAIDLTNAVRLLNSALPTGIGVREARVLKDGEPAAGAGLERFTYEAVPPKGFSGDLAGSVASFLACGEAFAVRKNDKGSREVDIRPMVAGMTVTGEGRVVFTTQPKDGRSAKPHEVVQALFSLSPDASRGVSLKRIKMA